MIDMLNRAADILRSEGWEQEAAVVSKAADKIERLREVVLLGVNARKCQVTYFKTRNRDALLVSKDAERAFDDAARVALEAMKYKTERT
jgi:hypothetical protein